MAKRQQVEIPEAKIRQVIWMRKVGKTKKACCEHLGIPYNTKKLDTIIDDFLAREAKEKELRKAAKTKVFSDAEKRTIAKAYLNGETQSALAKQFYVSPQRIKKFLIETNTPLRGRGKNSQGKTDHIIQDLETKFSKGEKVFISKYNCFGVVDKVYDEDYLEYLENGRQKYIEVRPFKPDPKTGMAGRYIEPTEGIHYETYWLLDDGSEMKMFAMLEQRRKIMKNLEEQGREYYLVARDDDFKSCIYLQRDEIFPVKAY